MKNILITLLLTLGIAEYSNSQTINWKSLREDQQNVLQVNLGYQYGFTSQISYNRSLSLGIPAMVSVDFSFPMGNELLDDYKIRLGGQVEVIEINGFSSTIRLSTIFRRYHSELVSISNFGADVAVVAGYYTSTWSVATELGFDKSMLSRLTHSDIMRSYFPAIKDGWYAPFGGHFYYGIDGGKTIGDRYSVSLRLGATKAQGNDENALIPFYLQLGLGTRF